MILKIGAVTLDIDVERTRAFYEDYPFNDCGCLDCRSFRAYAPDYEPSVHEFFRSLGVRDVRQAIELCPLEETSGMCICDGWFHLCGTILENGNEIKNSIDERGVENVQITPVWQKIGENFSVTVMNEELDLLPENFPLPAVQLEFCTTFPLLKK